MGPGCQWWGGRRGRIHQAKGSGREQEEEVKGSPPPSPCGGGGASGSPARTSLAADELCCGHLKLSD